MVVRINTNFRIMRRTYRNSLKEGNLPSRDNCYHIILVRAEELVNNLRVDPVAV